jgi:hypothetical protein
MANLTSSSSLGTNSLVMTKCTHRIRAIQHINMRVANMRMKTVGVSATNILVEFIEWGFWNEKNKRISLIYNLADSPMTFPVVDRV